MTVARTHARRLRNDDGAILVEAALVMPILLLLLMGIFEFGYLNLRKSQLSSASRDGARTGILNWHGADTGSYSGGTCPSSPTSYNAICTSVLKRLVGAQVSTITATCYQGFTTTVIACDDQHVTEGIDTLMVTVTYPYKPMTFVGSTFLDANHVYTSTTRMVLQ